MVEVDSSLEPPPHLAGTELDRHVEDVFIVLNFFFSTQRNNFSVIDFLISNMLLHAPGHASCILHAPSPVRQSEAEKLRWDFPER